MQSNCNTLSRSFLVRFISLVFSAFSWVSPASCSINFCFRSFTVSTTLSYLTNSASIPELHSVMISYSSPCPLLSSYTIGFISWYSSTLLTISLWHLWIGFNKLLPGILFVFLFVSCSISSFFNCFLLFLIVAPVVVMISSWQGRHFVTTVSPDKLALATIKNKTVWMVLTLPR